MTTACMSRSWKVEVCQNIKKNITRRDDQSAISRKEHVKYEATQTYLSVTYQHDRLRLTGKRPQQQQSTPSTHIPPKSLLGEKKHQTVRYGDECMPPLVSSVDTVYLLPLRVAQLNNRRNLNNITSRPRGRRYSQCCRVAFLGAVIVITTTSSSFSHACCCHTYLSMSVCTCIYRSKINKCTTTMIPTAVPWGFFSFTLLFVLGQNMTPIWK